MPTYGFDLALANNFNLIKSNVYSVLAWWQGKLSATQSPIFDAQSVQVAPNTFSDHLQVTVTALKTAPLTVNIYGIDGRLITQLANGQVVRDDEAKTWQWQAPAGLPDGLYYCSVRSGKQVRTLKVVKM